MARSNGAQGRRRRVAIMGGGFGGPFAARALRGAEVEVTVVDRPTITRQGQVRAPWGRCLELSRGSEGGEKRG